MYEFDVSTASMSNDLFPLLCSCSRPCDFAKVAISCRVVVVVVFVVFVVVAAAAAAAVASALVAAVTDHEGTEFGGC